MLTYDVIVDVADQAQLTLGSQLNQMSVTSGSQDGYDISTPSSLALSYIAKATDQNAKFWLGRRIQISIKPSDTATTTKVFYGWVTGVQTETVDPNGDNVIINLNAAGSLSRLGESQVGGGGFPAQNESARLNAIATQISNQTWTNVPSAITWNDIQAGIIWQDYDVNLNNAVSILGDNPTFTYFDLEAYSGGQVDALTFMLNFATGTSAILTDSPEFSTVYYSNFNGWSVKSADALDATSCVLADSLNCGASLADIYNVITYSNSTTSQSSANTGSIQAYGQRDLNVTTQMSNTTQMQTLITNRMVALSTPQNQLTSMTVDLDVLPAATRAKMYRTWKVQFWDVTGIPETFGGDGVYWQAGTKLNLDYYHAEVDMAVQSDALRRGITQWLQVSPSNLWNNYLTSTTTWAQVK